MRKLMYLVASTIDGFIADPSGADPTSTVFKVEGDHMAALLEMYPEMVPTHWRAKLGLDTPNKTIDAVLEGRKSWELGLEAGVTNAYEHLDHYVFSTTMTELPDPSVNLVNTDPVAKIQELKRQDGKTIWLCGGGKLAYSLRHEVDELVVKLNPVVIGSGIPLFDGGFDQVDFRLTGTRAFDSGVALLTYEKA